MLPSDPDYVSPCPSAVRHSPVLRYFLAQNWDPYAEHSYSIGIIQEIEAGLAKAPSVTTDHS